MLAKLSGMEKSFIVQAKGLEEALDKAAVVLHCEKERIAYELLQEPRPRRRAQPSLLCKLRVTPVAQSAEEMSGGVEADEIWHVALPYSESELAFLPPAQFLEAVGRAVEKGALQSAWETSEKPDARNGVLRNISGNISRTSSPIDHAGDLHVYGNVQKGVRIKASGTIIVDGGVETAFLDAAGDIQIGEGLLGTARSTTGSVSCRFAQGANIEAAQGNIDVRESAMHCQMHARGAIEIGDILLGGSCYGENLVQARIAGSDSGIVTQIWTGRNHGLEGRIEQIRQRAIRHVERLSECDAICQSLMPMEKDGIACSGIDRARLWRACVRKARLNIDLRRLSREKSALLGMINGEHGSRVCITDRVYPNVKISIDNAGVDIQRLTQFATFSKDYDLGELRVTPYN